MWAMSVTACPTYGVLPNKNTADNLKLLLEAADAELAESRQRVEAVEDVEAWLLALRERAWWRSRRI